MIRIASTSVAFKRLLRFARARIRPSVAPCHDESATVINPSHIAEDDSLRSRQMRRLIQEAAPSEIQLAPLTIPKVVIQFWHDASAIPTDVLECLDSWEPLVSQGFERILFDDFKARRFISQAFRSSPRSGLRPMSSPGDAM